MMFTKVFSPLFSSDGLGRKSYGHINDVIAGQCSPHLEMSHFSSHAWGFPDNDTKKSMS